MILSLTNLCVLYVPYQSYLCFSPSDSSVSVIVLSF